MTQCKIYVDHHVHHLGLAVSLWMEGYAHLQLDARHDEEITPHIACQHKSQSMTIEDGNPCRRTMPAKKARATNAAVYGWPSGMKCAYFEKQSTTC
jgi:hypothetical protein